MTSYIACGAELEPPVRVPHTVYVKSIYRIAGQDYCRHHIIMAAVAAGVITEIRAGTGPMVTVSREQSPRRRQARSRRAGHKGSRRTSFAVGTHVNHADSNPTPFRFGQLFFRPLPQLGRASALTPVGRRWCPAVPKSEHKIGSARKPRSCLRRLKRGKGTCRPGRWSDFILRRYSPQPSAA